MKVRALLAAGLLTLTAACSTPGATPFTVGLNTSLTMNVAIIGAAAIYAVYDPLAPNWELEETKLSDNTYRLSMKMKRFHTGGSGEALQVLKRRALQLREAGGHARYEILEYSEGIDSQTLTARRVAEGVVRLVPHPASDSFGLAARAY